MDTPFSIEIEIDDDWIAPVYDHVHHGRAMSLLERGREGLLERIGFPNAQLLQEGKVIVVTRVDVAYRRELKRGVVRVTCEESSCDGRTMKIRQKILNERGKVAVEGVVELMFMDAGTKRGMNPPEDFIRALLCS
jgi:acyl-CoA thioesterase FadM